MPAPRQILTDIHDMGLDPTKPHRAIKASGRLARHVVHAEAVESVLDECSVVLQHVTPDQVSIIAKEEPIHEDVHTSEDNMLIVNEEPTAHNEEEHVEVHVQEQDDTSTPDSLQSNIEETSSDAIVSSVRRGRGKTKAVVGNEG